MNTSPKRTLRSAIKSLRSNFAGSLNTTDLNRNFLKSQSIVRIYYIISVYISADMMRNTEGYVRSVTEWDFLWPLYWVNSNNAHFFVSWISVFCFVLSILSVILLRRRVVRILFSIFFLMAATIHNSSGGGINHEYHAWFWISFILIFLPVENGARSGDSTWSRRMSYLTVVFWAQVTLALFYTMAGFWKVYYGILSALGGLEGAFSLKGLSYQLADRMIMTNTSPLLAEFFIENYVLSWLGLLAVMYIQLTAIVAAFRPRLHVIWGIAIITFHLGTWLLMEIIFIEHVLLLMIFFVLSPIRERKADFEKTLGDLPLFGLLLLRISRGSLFNLPRRLWGRVG